MTALRQSCAVFCRNLRICDFCGSWKFWDLQDAICTPRKFAYLRYLNWRICDLWTFKKLACPPLRIFCLVKCLWLFSSSQRAAGYPDIGPPPLHPLAGMGKYSQILGIRFTDELKRTVSRDGFNFFKNARIDQGLNMIYFYIFSICL